MLIYERELKSTHLFVDPNWRLCHDCPWIVIVGTWDREINKLLIRSFNKKNNKIYYVYNINDIIKPLIT